MKIMNNVSLKPYNTFGIDVNTSFFSVVKNPLTVSEILAINEIKSLPLLIIGGGSNILFTKDFNGLVLKIDFRGIKHDFSGNDHVVVTAAAGERWDSFVEYCVNQGWGGLENLSLIPGLVGASPIQNIGAYGVELKDAFSHLEAFDLKTFELRRFTLSECKFGYRNSVFKNELKNRFLITSVSFNLSIKPVLNVSYPALLNEMEKTIEKPSIKSVADAVIRIRRSKLPDHKQLGNAGSFFKNPVISHLEFNKIKETYPSIPSFLQDDGSFKIPAAWLIEHCGLKGVRYGEAGVHHLQPLVLVNYGSATGQQILDLALHIKEMVYTRFGIHIETEVNII